MPAMREAGGGGVGRAVGDRGGAPRDHAAGPGLAQVHPRLMAFDADAFHATVSLPWQFTTGGRTYVAAHISTPEVERYLQVLEDAPFIRLGRANDHRV